MAVRLAHADRRAGTVCRSSDRPVRRVNVGSVARRARKAALANRARRVNLARLVPPVPTVSPVPLVLLVLRVLLALRVPVGLTVRLARLRSVSSSLTGKAGSARRPTLTVISSTPARRRRSPGLSHPPRTVG